MQRGRHAHCVSAWKAATSSAVMAASVQAAHLDQYLLSHGSPHDIARDSYSGLSEVAPLMLPSPQEHPLRSPLAMVLYSVQHP